MTAAPSGTRASIARACAPTSTRTSATKLAVHVSSVFNRAANDRGWNNNCNNFACHGYTIAYTPSFVDLRERTRPGNYVTPDWGIQANPCRRTISRRIRK